MANTIEIILQAIDKASDIILGVEKKATASNVAIAKSFENVGVASDAVDKKLGEYGAALDKTTIAQNKLRQAQFDAQESAQKLAQAQYNLAQNTDPTKVDDLNKTLAKAQVELDGAAQQVQKLSKDLRDGKSSADEMGGGLSKMQASIIVVNQAMQIAGQVVGEVKKIYDETIGSLVSYGAKVKDLSVTLSLSAEETSKIISVSSKFGVSTDTLTHSLEMMTKRGMAPSLEGLAQLSDKVMSISDPVERSKVLVDLFGRAWVNLMPILEKGGTAIRAAGEEANKFGTVLNEKDVNAIEELTIANNTLQAEIDGLKFKMTKGLVPSLVDSGKNLITLTSVLDGTATATDKAQYAIDILGRAYGKNDETVVKAQKILDDYKKSLEATAITTEEKTLRANMALVRSFGEVQTGIGSLVQGTQNQANVYDVLDAAMSRVSEKTALLDANQRTLAADAKIVAGQLSDLHTKMGGAAQNEMKSYEERQGSLAEQAKKVAEEIAKLQRESSKTSVQHKMSANELALAQAQLADMEAKYAAGATPVAQAHKKTKETAEEAAAAEEKMARAAQNSAGQHAVLGAQIAVLKDKINGANESVTTYTDNSERIGDLRDQYAGINDEIKKNADEHELATKRIVFGYLEQELAAQGMTEKSTAALNALAEKWGLLSKADIAALNDARIAAKTFAQDGSFEHLAASANAAVADAKKPAQTAEEAAKAASKATGGLSDLITGQSTTINKALDSTKQPSQEFITNAKKMQNEFDTSRDKAMELVNYGLNPMSSTLSVLTQQVSIFSQALGSLPGVSQLLSTYAPPTSPTNPNTRTYPLQGGAQYGADFVVPPNPRGGMGDYYPVIAAPGERVQVTPRGSSGGGNIPAINITQNFSGAQSSPEQYRSIVYDVMNDVIRSVMKQ